MKESQRASSGRRSVYPSAAPEGEAMYATVVQSGTGPVRGAGARRGRLDRMKTGDGSPIHRRRRRTFFALRKCTSNGIAVDFWRGFHASRADGLSCPRRVPPPSDGINRGGE